MFGYVYPAPERLSEEEKGRFRAVYCGLCHNLGQRYSFVSRFFLNYDFTFLAMLLEDKPCRTCAHRCVAHPLKKRECLGGGRGLDTAADVSMVLLWWQIQDEISDHGFGKGLKYRLVACLLHRAYKKAKVRQPGFDTATQTHLHELALLEEKNCPSIDRPADTFARLLSGVSQVVDEPIKRRVLAELLYHMGRWIYLVDAADDLKKDVSGGQYNPLPLRYQLQGDTLTEEAKISLAQTMDESIRAMAAAFELWNWGDYTPIIRATVYDGLYGVGHAVLNGTFHQKAKKRQSAKEDT